MNVIVPVILLYLMNPIYPGHVGIRALTVILSWVSDCSWWKVSSTAKDLVIVCFLEGEGR